MGGIRGGVKLLAVGIALAIVCTAGYFVLLDLVRPHPAQDLGDQGGYVVTPYDPKDGGLIFESGYDVAPEEAAQADTSGTDGLVNFWDLPLWIQLTVLPGLLLGLLLSFIAAALVVRRTRKSNNGNKREVLTYIVANPGCTAPELARDEHMNIGTVRYHIQRLENEGRIVLQKIGKYTRIFVNSHTYNDQERLVAAHLHSDSSCRILGALMDAPGISNQKLSDRLGMEKSLVYRYVQKLLDDGIITCEWEGKVKLYYISQSAKEPLIRLMPRNYQCPGLMKE